MNLDRDFKRMRSKSKGMFSLCVYQILFNDRLSVTMDELALLADYPASNFTQDNDKWNYPFSYKNYDFLVDSFMIFDWIFMEMCL